MRSLSLLVLFLAALTLGGCYRTTIISGRPPKDEPATSYDRRMTSIIVGDIIRIDKPYDFGQACPEGWGTIEIETTFVDGLLNLLASALAGLPVYQAKSVTIHCAAEPVHAEAAPSPPSKRKPASRKP